MAIRLSQEVETAIRQHGAQTYPEECCGLLLGRVEDGVKLATAVWLVANSWSAEVRLTEAEETHSLRDRFYIPPQEYLRADRHARSKGLDIVGCYHSHPDDRAHPSERDRVGAAGVGGGPLFSFLVLSVPQGQPAELTSWLLEDDRWVEEDIL